jgi:hypothetical protein
MRAPLFCLLVLASLAACDSGTPEVSSFSATLSGDIDRQIQGAAGIRTSPEWGELSFRIEMVPGGFGAEALSLTSEGLGITQRGTYEFGVTRGGWIGLEYAGASARYGATTGTVEITRFRDNYMAGSFSATLASASGDETVEVTGSFEALASETILY